MKTGNQKWEVIPLYIVLAFILGLAVYILVDIDKTRKSLLNSFMLRPMESIEHHLQSFFHPVAQLSDMALNHAQEGVYALYDSASVNTYFMPLLEYFPSITSIGVADTNGYEYDILSAKNELFTRTVRPDATGGHNYWGAWNKTMDTCMRKWTEAMREDPRRRPWYTGAMKMNGNNHWTGPYMFNTDSVLGITLSNAKPMENGMGLVALDITLEHLSQFMSKVRVGKRGGAFLLTRNLEPISVPKGKDKEIVKVINIITDEIKEAFTGSDETIDLRVKIHHEQWCARVMRFDLDNSNHLFAVVAIPEQEMMAELNRSTNIIYLGMFLTALFTAMLLVLLQRLRKANKIGRQRAEKIMLQNQVISEHNVHVQESLDYAQRIQSIMLPRVDDMAKETMQQVMVLYLPKDTLSGDFYWGRHRKHISYFSVADCTGHGVPGAMMSVLGMDLLNAKVGIDLTSLPENLLFQLRRMLIGRMRKGDTVAYDGMDIALCRLDHVKHTLDYAGAYIPLLLVRSKAYGDALEVITNGRNHELSPAASSGSHHVFMIKGDRMPLGFVDHDHSNVFAGNQIKLKTNDSVYLMSDGMADQFGGSDNHKFGQRRLRNTLLELEPYSIEERQKKLHAIIQNHMGNEQQIDDICIMNFIFRPQNDV